MTPEKTRTALAKMAGIEIGQRGGIRIVFHRHRHAKYLLQVLDQIFPAPTGKEAHVSDLAGERIYRASRSDSNAGELRPGFAHGRPQHVCRAFERALVRPISLGCRFATKQQLAFGIHDPDRNLRPSNINRSDHWPPKIVS